MKVVVSEVRLHTAFGDTDASLLALGLGESVLSLPPEDPALSALDAESMLEPFRQLTMLQPESEKRPLMLGLAASTADPDHRQAKAAFNQLHERFPDAIDSASSALFPFGRAAGLMALEAGLQRCRQTHSSIWVGALHRPVGQSSGNLPMDADTTSKAAVFLRLDPLEHPSAGALVVSAAATELEATTDDSAQPTGLGRAMHRLFEQHPVTVQTWMPAAAGDRQWLHDWSYAQQRNRGRIRPDFRLISTGALLGDTGAATALIHLAQCWAHTQQGLTLGSTLLTAGSDWLYRSAALLETGGQEAAQPPLTMASLAKETRVKTPSSKDSTTP